MKWKVEYKKTFLKELSKLSSDTKSNIESINPEFDNPFDELPLEKMTGYTDKYKIRIGNYRIGLTIYSNKKSLNSAGSPTEKIFIKYSLNDFKEIFFTNSTVQFLSL